jgi:geranylgeranyl pyrophosphate synthase
LFGYHLGLAFQVQDDILGIWGDEAVTGKSAASDLVEGKNSLPVLYALGKQGNFAKDGIKARSQWMKLKPWRLCLKRKAAKLTLKKCLKKRLKRR